MWDEPNDLKTRCFDHKKVCLVHLQERLFSMNNVFTSRKQRETAYGNSTGRCFLGFISKIQAQCSSVLM